MGIQPGLWCLSGEIIYRQRFDFGCMFQKSVSLRCREHAPPVMVDQLCSLGIILPESAKDGVEEPGEIKRIFRGLHFTAHFEA